MKKSLMEKLIFCAVNPINPVVLLSDYAQEFFSHQNLLKSFPQGCPEGTKCELINSYMYAILPITYQINDNVLSKFLSIFCSHFTYMHNSFWIVCIDVKYWTLNNFTHIRAIRRRPRHTRVRCKANLNQRSIRSIQHT